MSRCKPLSGRRLALSTCPPLSKQGVGPRCNQSTDGHRTSSEPSPVYGYFHLTVSGIHVYLLLEPCLCYTFTSWAAQSAELVRLARDLICRTKTQLGRCGFNLGGCSRSRTGILAGWYGIRCLGARVMDDRGENGQRDSRRNVNMLWGLSSYPLKPLGYTWGFTFPYQESV